MKKPLIYLLSAGLILSLTTGATTYAVGTDSSEASVNFSAPTDAVDPVDPENPANPYPDNAEADGNNTTQAGPLSLDYVSHIDFGDHDISTSEQTYESTTESPFIQVTDRRGTGGGWNVTAAANSFTSESDNTLPGAVITFANGATNSTSTTNAPIVNSNIELDTNGTSVNVATAAAREDGAAVNTAQGLGTWVMSWLTDAELNENVTLYVPESAATAGNHTAIIDWTLTEGPGA